MTHGCRVESSLLVAVTKWFILQAQFLLHKKKVFPKGDRDEMQAVYVLLFFSFGI